MINVPAADAMSTIAAKATVQVRTKKGPAQVLPGETA
jgi:hypothetical protein